ncbi:hypothetical protein [Sporotomaculum syntrophicum]|nr:hypothetical protein [Sporotomaculum syntrophicum]
MIIALAGCGNTNSLINNEINPNIDVLGIKLNMPEAQVHELAASQGKKDMCINGYEYNYADKLINIGFDANQGKVRRITTKNPDTSIFGIKPGVDLATANAQLEKYSFSKEQASEFKFHKENVMLTIISMHGTLADGVTIELITD